MVTSRITRITGRSIHFVCGALMMVVLQPQNANALIGEHNKVPEICQAVGGTAYAVNELAAFIAPAPFDFPPTLAAYAANLNLRLCPPQVLAPNDLVGINGFQPDAETATSSDIELSDPFTQDPNCYASIPQSLTKEGYENFLGASIFGGDWGTLGTPQVYHFNTAVDVRMFGGSPPDNPDTDRDESLADERKTTRNAQGQTVLKLPVGRNSITYRADTVVSPLDFVFIYIPNFPSHSKPFRELVKSSGVLRAVAAQGFRAFKSALPFIATETGLFTIDQAVGINWRHGQLGVFDDIINQDSQNVSVYDLIPPVLTTRTDTSTLPTSIQAVLSYDAARDVFYLEAIHPGGIRNSTGIDFLRRLLDFHDHCNRQVSLSSNAGGLDFWPTGGVIDLIWSASDPGPTATGGINTVSLTHKIEIRDSFPPVLLAPPSQVHELPAGQQDQTISVDLGVPRVFDLADLSPDLSNDAPGNEFGLGLSEITWMASDGFNTSSAVQLINVKEEGTNTPPVADAQTVQTESFEDTEIILTGSDADFHPSVDRFDPLTFSIINSPDEGNFVAPLLPFFIEDFRLEASSLKFAGNLMQEDPALYCDTRTGADPNQFQIEYPYQPDWMAVDDAGNTMVYDIGSARCDSNNDLNVGNRLAIFDANQDLSAFLEISAGGTPSDIFWDDLTDLIYVSRIDNQDDDWVYVYTPDLIQLTRYNLGTGFSAPWMLDRPEAVTVDSRGIMYVATNNRINAYSQVDDGSTQVVGSEVYLGHAWFPDSGFPGSIQSLTTDSDNNLYISYPDRIVKVSAAELDQSNIFTAGEIIGWLGYCSSNLTTESACDTPNNRSFGYACTNELCGRDTPNYGSEPGQFRQAKGIAMNPDNILYVSDFGNERVQRFTADGSFGGEARSTGVGYGFLLGDFGNPSDIEVNSDHFYILNQDSDLMHIFETSPITPVDDGSASVIYRSDNNFIGTDQFRFEVTDGFDSAEADVTIQVTRNFRPPEVPGSGLAFVAPVGDEDTPLMFTLPATDPDGSFDTLSIVVVAAPEHGNLTFNGLEVTYTPDPNYFGPDEFSYQVSDGNETSEQTGTVSIDISPLMDAPEIEVPQDQTANIGFRVLHQIDVVDPDPDETLMITINWGDGTITKEGHFELNGEPIPPMDALDPNGMLLPDVTATGPVLATDPMGRGRLMADHVFTTAGTYQVTTCVFDQVEVDPESQQKNATGLSQQVCGLTNVAVGSAAELLIDVQDPNDDQPTGAEFDLTVKLRNLSFDLDPDDPRFPQLPAMGADIVNLTLSGELPKGLELIDLNTVDGLCTVNGNTFECTFTSLAYSTDTTLTVSIRVAQTAPGRALLGVLIQGDWIGKHETPSGAGIVKVESNGDAPSLIQISPIEGGTEGFTEVTFTGSNFEAGVKVLFDSRPGTQVVVVDNTSLTVLVPAAPAGVVDVIIINPDEQESKLAGAWTYVAQAPPPPSSSGGGGGRLGWLSMLSLLLLIALVGLHRRQGFAWR